jgi:hypothetical protein
MNTFTRVTVIGSARKATLVLPSEEPVGVHLADIASLLAEPARTDAGSLTLVTPVGVEVDQTLTLSQQHVLDGNVLLLIRAEDAPPPPEVTDVTDTVADFRDATTWAWSERHRVIAGAVALGAVAAAALSAIPATDTGMLCVTFLLLVAISVGLGRTRLASAGTLATGTSIGAALPTAIQLGAALAPSIPHAPAVVALASGLVWIALGAGLGAARRDASASIGAAVGAALSSVVLILLALELDTTYSAAIVGVIMIAALGMLPTIALTVSGTASLDDRVIAGLLPNRENVELTVANAYRLFGWTVYALAVWLLLTAVWLVSQNDVWSLLLGLAIVVVTLLRTRVMPLAVHAWPLFMAGGIAGLTAILESPAAPQWLVLSALALGAIAVLIAVLARPSIQGRIRLRRLGDQIETLAAVALIPCLLGVFGVYIFMLGVF